MLSNDLIIRPLKSGQYLPIWHAMQDFTNRRNETTRDEIWFIEHPPVYTLGQAGKPEHILNPGNIPVIPVDRGGQVTYHGPGQLMIYVLSDIRRRKMGVRELVTKLEQTIIDLLADYGVEASARKDAPGVYVNGAKICSIGLRIRRGCSYHGLAFNVAMDLEPFAGINPCGFVNLPITQLADLGGAKMLAEAVPLAIKHLVANLGYTNVIFRQDSQL